MRNEAMQIISLIKKLKQKQNKIPSHATRSEILNVLRTELDESLKQLVDSGELTKCETINDVAYDTK